MKTSLLLVLLVVVRQKSIHGRESRVKVVPDSTQFFEYKQFSVSCEEFGPGDWTVWRITKSGDLSRCGSRWGTWNSSVCELKTLKPYDSGVYWCESKYRESSKTINITVTGGPVILESPVQVEEGQDMLLNCRSISGHQDQKTNFYWNGTFLKNSSEHRTTIQRFSRDQQDQKSPPVHIYLQEDSPAPSLVLSPDSEQALEYSSVVLSCVPQDRAEGWTVHRYKTTQSGPKTGPQCGSGWGSMGSGPVCKLTNIKTPDNGIYWCGKNTQRSNSVHLKVKDRGVVLQVPVLPVTEGQTVSLSCRHHTSSNLTARFHRDGHFLWEEPTGHMTLQQVSVSDEGLYQCEIRGETSESSWLRVRPVTLRTTETPPTTTETPPTTAETPPPTTETLSPSPETLPTITETPPPSAETPPPASERPLALALLCHLVVLCPYVVSTVLMVSLYRQTLSEQKCFMAPPTQALPTHSEPGLDEDYDDVIAVTTEHQF